MRAIQVTELNGPAGMALAEVPDPVPAGDQVLIAVTTAGVAFPDLLLSHGRYQLRPDPPFTPGLEVAGTVVVAPPGSGLLCDQRVMGFCSVGGFAERVAVPAAFTFPIPDGMSDLEAGGFGLNYHTAHFTLLRRGRVEPGETVLVHGAAGGVGVASIQVANAIGARVIAVASTPGKQDVARKAGAEEVLAGGEGWKDRVLEATNGRGVDAVVDVVGGDVFDDSVRVLAPEGRLLVVGFTSGEIPAVRVNRLLLRNADVVGVAWGAYIALDPSIARQTAEDLARMYAEGHLAPLIGPTFPLEDAAKAVATLEDRSAVGKVMLTL